TSGTIPGGFDASGIIQGIDDGGYEFEKVFPSLMIRELWEEKEESAKKMNSSEEDLEQKRKEITKTNQELSTTRNELSDLQNKFSNLRLEKDEKVKRLSSLEESLKKEREDVEKKKQGLINSEEKIKQLQNQLDDFRKENLKMKNEKKLHQLAEELQEMLGQGLKDNIQTKLEVKKKEQEQLKFAVERELGNQIYLLDNLLEKQENFDLAVFEDVSQRSKTFVRAQDKLQEAKDKLVAKLSPEEIEEFCQIQTEISKLEIQEKQ
ncbi:16217_t:CDS:2, partial [Funneliformis geosporum]